MLYLYTLQICNTFSQDILHQETYDNSAPIESLIEMVKHWQECYIYDDKKRTLKGSYLYHSIIIDEVNTIYKVFFDVGLERPMAKTLVEQTL